jgi:hypothetical protein
MASGCFPREPALERTLTVRGATRRPYEGMKLTKPEHIGAALLIPGVRQTIREGDAVVNRAIRLLILLCATASCSDGAAVAEESKPLASRLVGHWSLVSLEVVAGQETEYPLGRDVSGVIMYDAAGHMAVQIMRADRPLFASGDQAAGTPAELSAAVKGYVAYFGSYTVNENAGVVTHHLTGSLFPNWVGSSQRRGVVLAGDQLTLSSAPIVFQGKQQVFRIVWKRQE